MKRAREIWTQYPYHQRYKLPVSISGSSIAALFKQKINLIDVRRSSWKIWNELGARICDHIQASRFVNAVNVVVTTTRTYQEGRPSSNCRTNRIIRLSSAERDVQQFNCTDHTN